MEDKYDVVIIGAGVGGLLTGNYLVRQGLRTLLLEQHTQPGGYLCGFRRQGFYFDGGDQSFGSSGLVFPVLEQLGLDREVRFVRADYRWHTPWADFKVDSLAGVQQAVTAAFPDQRTELESYFKDLGLLVEGVRVFSEQPNPFILSGWARLSGLARLMAHWRVMKAINAFSTLSGLELAEKHFSDPRLVEFFGRFGYTGAPAVATAGAWACWLYDYWYPIGGLQGFADLLANSFVEHRGVLRYRTRVARLLIDQGQNGGSGRARPGGPRALGVVTTDGEAVHADYVVSAGDHRRLALELLPPDGLDLAWRVEAAASPVSDSIFSVYLGVDLPPEQLADLLHARHVFVMPEPVPLPQGNGEDPDWHARRWVEVSCPSLADPTLAPPGKSSLILQCMSSYDWMDRWGTGPTGERTERYRALKTRVAGQLLRTAERVIPNLARHIVVQDAATPLTMERYTLNSEGATAGWTWDPRKNPVKAQGGRYATPVANLLEAGHWTARIGGVPTSALSARLVSKLIAGKAARRR
jgi:phytoene dehydrogenase-like protein